MMNRIVLVGRLTKDPELKYTPNGVAVCSFTLAVNRPFKNANGDNEADFINVQVWRKQAENAANYLGKGKLAGVDGRLQIRTFDGQDGNRVWMTEVVAESVQFLEPKNSNTGDVRDSPAYSGQQQQQRQQQNQNNNNNNNNNYTRVDEDPFAGNNGGPIDISDDDLPF